MDGEQAVPLVVRGLGAAEIRVGSLVLTPDQGMFFPLALLLAQRAGERIARAELVQIVWPDAPDSQARHSLRQALYRLRKAGLAMEDLTDEVRIDPAMVDSDLSAMLRHDWPYQADQAEIERALKVLPGFLPADGSALAEWCDHLRAQLSAQFRRASVHRLGLARREGRWHNLYDWALMLLRGDPLNEEATLACAEATAMLGAKNAAIEILDAYLREIGDNAKVIGLPARLLKRRISELTDTTSWRATATSAPFVGRHALLARGQDALGEVRAGAATAVWFVGPAGIGKSRLQRELARAARMAGWCVVQGGARPSYEERPFALLTEILPQLLEAPGAIGTDPDALALLRQVGRAAVDDEPLAPEEARGRQHAVYLAWRELMDAVLSEAPLAIFLDDAQWADPTTLLILARLLESRPSAKLAVMLSARRVPVRDDRSAQRLLGAAQLRVDPMTKDEIREFARAVGFVEAADFDEVTGRLGAASGGNPLFLGHLLHHHQTHRAFDRMPQDLATLIDEQMRSLSPEALRLLQVCALLGKHATLPRVERTLGITAAQLVAPFGELDDALALPSEPGQPLTPHDLWTDRVRHAMTAGRLRSLAVCVARVLEADAQDESGIEIYWDVARLYQESGEKQLAYKAMMRCAEYLIRTGGTSDAVRAFEAASEYAVSTDGMHAALQGKLRAQQAEDLWAGTRDTLARLQRLQLAWTPELRANIELALLNSDYWLNSDDASMISRLRGLASDDQLSGSSRLSSAVLGMAVCDNSLDADQLRWFYQTCKEIEATTVADTISQLKCQIIFETAAGSLSNAETICKDLLDAARRTEDHSAMISAFKFAHYPPRRLGHFDLARQRLERAREITNRFKQAHTRATVSDLLAGLHLDYGDCATAIALTHEVTGHDEALGGTFRQQSAFDTRALALFMCGKPDEACLLVAPPDVIIRRGRRRAQFMSLSATLLAAVHKKDDVTIRECLLEIDLVRERLFRHSGPDLIAMAYAKGLMFERGMDAARSFARWYRDDARRDRLPLLREISELLPD